MNKKTLVLTFLIYIVCVLFWWYLDSLWESLWAGVVFLLIGVILLNGLFLGLCIKNANLRQYNFIFIILPVLLVTSEYGAYHLSQNPLESYYIKDFETVSGLKIPSTRTFISKLGKYPDNNGHYHYTFTVKLDSNDYLNFKSSALKSKYYNDTTRLNVSSEDRAVWNIDTDKLDYNLHILNAKGSLDIRLIDNRNVIIVGYNDI